MPDKKLVENIMNHLKICYKHGKSDNSEDHLRKAQLLLEERKEFKPNDEHAKWDLTLSFPKQKSESYYRDYIKTTLIELSELDYGKQLLRSFLDKISERKEKFPIIFSSYKNTKDENDTTTFSSGIRVTGTIQDEWQPHITINMWDGKRVTVRQKENIYTYSVGGLLKPQTIGNRVPKGLIEISSGLTPFYITLAHELIHAQRYFINKGEMFDAQQYVNPYQEENRIRVMDLYPDAEEERTVLSPNDFSELVLRIEANEMIRYPYHFSGEKFYEPISNIIKNIFDSYHRDDAKLEPRITEHDVRNILQTLVGHTDPLSPTSSIAMPEDVKKGAIYTKVSLLPRIYSYFYSNPQEIPAAIDRDLSQIHHNQVENQWRAANPGMYGPIPSERFSNPPQSSIVAERLQRPNDLAKALIKVNEGITEKDAIGNALRKVGPEYPFIARAFANVRRKNPLPLPPYLSPSSILGESTMTTTFSDSTSSSSSSSSSSDNSSQSFPIRTPMAGDSPSASLPSTATPQGLEFLTPPESESFQPVTLESELIRKLARATYTKLVLTKTAPNSELYEPNEKEVTDEINNLIPNITTPTSSSSSSTQPPSPSTSYLRGLPTQSQSVSNHFTTLMRFYGTPPALLNRKTIAENISSKWYLGGFQIMRR